jgi:hypothetical protein
VNMWVFLAVVALIAIVVLVPSGEPARRSERLIAAWRRRSPENTNPLGAIQAEDEEEDRGARTGDRLER